MPAATLNTFHTILLRSVTGKDDITIVVNNHPLPRSNASVQVLICITVLILLVRFISLIINTIYNEKYFSERQFSYLVHVLANLEGTKDVLCYVVQKTHD